MCILRKCFVFAVLLLLAAGLNAQVWLPPTGAQPLATLHWSYFGGIRALATEMVFSVNYLQTASASIDPTTRILASSWTPAMAGQSVIATANSEPNYARFVSLLTDGAIEEVGIAFGLVPVYEEQPWQYKMEPIAFSTRPANWNGVDLGGFTITAMELRLNQVSIISPGQDPVGDGFWTDFAWDASLTIYTVPEPGAPVLLLVAGICRWFCFVRRKGITR